MNDQDAKTPGENFASFASLREQLQEVNETVRCEMLDPAVVELVHKVDEMSQAVHRLEKRLASVEAREPGKIYTKHPHIVRVQGICGGRPVIEGTRLSVKLIVGWTRLGMTPAEIVAQYPEVSSEQIEAALVYYQAHAEEIEAEFAEEKRYLEVEIPRLQTLATSRNKAT